MKNKLYYHICFTALLFNVLCNWAYGASIKGKVIDSTGRPLSNIQIEIRNGLFSNFNYPIGITSASGEFIFDNIPPESYRLYAFDYFKGIYYQPPREEAYGILFDLRKYQDEIHDIGDIEMALGGCIEGRVKNSSEERLNNIIIIAEPVDTTKNIYYSRERICFCKKDGSFSICGLEPGSYRVKVRGAMEMGYTDIDSNADIITLAPGEIKAGIEYELQIGGIISGMVMTVDGDPLRDIYIQWEKLDLQNPQSSLVKSDSNGIYSIGGLEAGFYTIQTKIEQSPPGSIHHAPQIFINSSYHTPVNVSPGIETSGINIILYKGGIISGNVLYDHKEESPYEGLLVVAEKVPDRLLYWSAPLAKSGEYKIYGLDEGTYIFYLETLKSSYFNYGEDSKTYFAQYYNNTFIRDAATVVSVHPGDEKQGIDFIYQQGLSLAGKVYDDKTGEPVTVFFGYVSFYSEDKKVIKSVRLHLPLNPTDGFCIEGIPPGKYYLLFHDDYNIYEDAYYNVTGKEKTLENATLVDLESGHDTLVLDIFLASKKGSISGRIIREIDQAPIAHIPVMLKKIYDRSGTNLAFNPIETTDENGYYCFDGLGKGDYFLLTIDREYIYTNELYADIHLDNDDFLEIYMMPHLVPDIMIPEMAHIITISPSEHKKEINFSLLVGSLYSGPKPLVFLTDQFSAPEILSSPDKQIKAGNTYEYQVVAIDEDPDDILTYHLELSPDDMVIDQESGLIRWSPDTVDRGVEIVKIVVYDSHNMMASQAYSLSVL
ncbi:MAG: putative Ig domain-containing protein [bacterium]